MPTVVFMYSIKDSNEKFYGKYICDYISDDHDGLDQEILPTLYNGLNRHRKQLDVPLLNVDNNDISIGIISCSTNNNWLNYTSQDEYKFFDFYYILQNDMKMNKPISKYYIKGVELVFEFE